MSQLNQLKDAEKKASQLVQDARKARVDRMKEAKAESEQILAAYKKELEDTYQAAVAKHSGSSGDADNALDASTQKEIIAMKNDFDSNKKVVSKMLIDLVTNVNIEAPKAKDL